MTISASGDFLAVMAAGSAERARELRRVTHERELMQRIADTVSPPAIRFDPAGFDLIAEIKLTSPSAGVLAARDDDLVTRARRYAEAGACAVSVLTEPRRFGGSLEHLWRVAEGIRAYGIPAMAKDFLVDPWQIMAARAAGAGGVLLIVRLMDDGRLAEMLDCAVHLGLFTLIETFSTDDLERAGKLLDRTDVGHGSVLVGVNCRDLRTLAIDPGRLRVLAPGCPGDRPAVAESGILSPADAGDAARLGYRVGLVGTALMTAEDPGALVRDMLTAGRTHDLEGR